MVHIVCRCCQGHHANYREHGRVWALRLFDMKTAAMMICPEEWNDCNGVCCSPVKDMEARDSATLKSEERQKASGQMENWMARTEIGSLVPGIQDPQDNSDDPACFHYFPILTVKVNSCYCRVHCKIC